MTGGPLDPDGELRDLASDCVHCGFCLPACPTYQLWGEEMDSPRGRIHLISQILDSGQGGAAAGEHFDRCLGCMACMTACPSGVQYDQLIEAARSWAEPGPSGLLGAVALDQAWQAAPAPLPARTRRDRAVRAAIFATFPYANRLRALLGPLRA
ncbi:MAG TPA: 4Fe-4S dicluster domain-containing protein, partial [Streptosporangiaceae bacterium]